MKKITRTIPEYVYYIGEIKETDGKFVCEITETFTVTGAQLKPRELKERIGDKTVVKISEKETLYECSLEKFLSVATVVAGEPDKAE